MRRDGEAEVRGREVAACRIQVLLIHIPCSCSLHVLSWTPPTRISITLVPQANYRGHLTRRRQKKVNCDVVQFCVRSQQRWWYAIQVECGGLLVTLLGAQTGEQIAPCSPAAAKNATQGTYTFRSLVMVALSA